MIKEVSGNLFEARVEALVNTVNTAGAMGKGLALQFKKAFPLNFEAYAKACKRGEVAVGKMFVFDVEGVRRPRFIVNFPTKQHWRDDSRLEFIEQGLDDLLRVMAERKIKSIAIPPLGAGLGRLDWSTVRDLAFRKLDSCRDVEIHLFKPLVAEP